jgi:ADP-glucose pyrophosphorylase
MKQIIMTAIFSLLALNCHSNPTNTNSSSTTSLTGQWRWISTSGGISGGVIKPSNNNKQTLLITSDSLYNEYRNDTLTFSDQFTIIKAKTIYSIDSLNVIDFHTSKRFNLSVLRLAVDTLVLGDNVFDGYIYEYSKINP